MGPLPRFWIFFVGCALAAAVLSPWVYLGTRWAAAAWDWGWLQYLAAHPFHRFFNRVLQAGLLLGIWPLLRSSGFNSLAALGLRSRRPLRLWLTGLGLGLLAMGGYLLVIVGSGLQKWTGLSAQQNGSGIIVKIAATALLVGVFEEIFFRGYFYQLSTREMGRKRALALNMVFFSILHYIKPSRAEELRNVDWASGFQMIAMGFHRFSQPSEIMGGLLVLMAAAWFLCWSFDRTTSLYLPIGLHAGWIAALQGAAEITRGSSSLPKWFLGGGDLSQGLLVLAPLAVQVLVLRWWFNRDEANPSVPATVRERN